MTQCSCLAVAQIKQSPALWSVQVEALSWVVRRWLGMRGNRCGNRCDRWRCSNSTCSNSTCSNSTRANSTQQPIIFKRSNDQNPIAFFSPCLVIVFSPSHTNRPDAVLAKDIWKMYETCLVLPAEVEFSKIFAEIVKYGRSTGV